ncbi:MAG: alkaline phosphatase, partial [Allorhizobium sp.]
MRGFDSVDVTGYAVLLGSVSAALIFAAVLLRQRNKLDVEVRELRSAYSDSQQKISRYQTLIADKNRRTVIWEGHNGKAELLGQLPAETGAPQQDPDFLAFGRWLKPHSASEVERAIEGLRLNAKSFDLVVETQRGDVLEVQGNLYGGRAYAHFVALDNLRAELAELKIERNRLRSSIATFESLLDSIEQPVWQRDSDGRLVWVNQ